jgi:acyl-CoA synthetase (NDP forming)
MEAAMSDGGLAAVFEPRGVAVIGASADPNKMGSVMATSLRTFPGSVVLVNERGADRSAGLRASVAEGVDALGGSVDLAVLCVPAGLCAGALDRAASAGVTAALVCAGGFAEAGADGARAQAALLDVARRRGIRLLGPTTSGFIAPARGLYASFVPGAQKLEPGSIGVIAASGGVNHALAFLLARAGHGVRLAVGLGNAIDIDTPDVIDHMADDRAIRAIAVHLESVRDGTRLLAAVRRAAAIKPIVALTVGRADVGDFARSHTGALATAWRTTRALLAQAGAVVVDDERELVDAVTALSLTRLAASPDPGVALVTAQAGPGLLVMDELRHAGIRLPHLTDKTQASLARLLPPITYQANPVDTGRPGESFTDVLRCVAADPGVDLMAVYALSEPGAVDLADAVASGTGGSAPLLMAVGGVDDEALTVRDKLLADDISVAIDPTGLAAGVRALVTDARDRSRRSTPGSYAQLSPDVAAAVKGTAEWTEHDAKSLLDLLGITTPRRIPCGSDHDAIAAFAKLRKPLAVKLLDATVLHKTEVGGVHLGIHTPEQLRDAVLRLRAVGAKHVLIEEMADDGVDLIVGARRDPVFGPVVLAGLGGTVAEALADVTLRAAPLTVEEAAEMPGELLGHAILTGWRGGPLLDPTALGSVVARLGQVLADNADLDEIEINPLRVTRSGLIALDAVVTLRSANDQPYQ